MKKQLLLLASLFILAGSCLAQSPAPSPSIADSPDNRQKEAARYLQAVPPKELFADMAKKMSMNLPADQRDAFIDLFTKNVDMDAMTKAMSDAMVRHFTAAEIGALADFYGSPVGKSAMGKFGDYMADLMPTIQAEMMKAQAKANQSQPSAPK